MHQDFWQERWQQGQIGFHQAEINTFLEKHWTALQLAPGAKVLVPLCGKSLDMCWLAAQDFAVLGVELAEKAVQDFFTEQGLQPDIREHGVFRIYRAGQLELWCGDFFALTSEDVAGCSALYDRAALIALPLAMRERYAAHMAGILPSNCRGLLITLDYPQEQMPGPPFAIPEAEVQRLLQANYRIELLEQQDVLKHNQRFSEAGLTRLIESVYKVHKV